MVDDHLERLSRREGALGRSFRAAIAFARSSNETSRGRYLAAVGHLMESFVLAPVRNEAFRIILWPFLRRKCLGTMLRGGDVRTAPADRRHQKGMDQPGADPG